MKEFFKSILASAIGTFVAGLGLCFLMFVLMVGLVSSSGTQPETTPVVVKPKTMVVIGNGLAINDTPEHGTPGLASLLGGSAMPEVDLLRALEAIDLAAKDNNVAGLLIAGEIEAGFVQLNELRQAILKFKESKKPVIGWVENSSQREYYLTSAADKIYMHPASEVELKGLASYHMYYGETLKLLGVGVQVTKVGKYKSAVEPFIGDKMSDPAREQTELLLNGVWNKLLTDVSLSRKVTIASLRRAADVAGIYNAEKAKSLKLVDGILQRDELIAELRKLGVGADESGTSFRQMSLAKYAHKVQLPRRGERVAIVYAEGEIVDGWGGEGSIGGDRLARDLRELRADPRVRAVVLRVNSPGGSAFASDVIAREVGLLRKQGIPVVVSMGDLAASGGYYIAARGSVIMADPSTITGSIGVFGLHFNYQELAKKVNLGTDGVKTNRYANLFDMDHAATAEEMAVVQATVDGVYEDFLKVVSEGRKMERDSVHEIAQGRVWLGLNAREKGLVDKFGGLRDAIREAKELAKIKDAELIQVPALHSGRENLLQKLLSEDGHEMPLFARAQSKDPALLFLKSHAETLKAIRSLNDPRGVYLSCPLRGAGR
jgi:protease-4